MAGVDLFVSRPLPGLAPFAISDAAAEAFEGRATACRAPVAEPARSRYDGPGWLGGRWRQVECRCASGRYLLTIEGLKCLSIASTRDTVEIVYDDTDGIGEPGLLQEALLGPALMLALARHGIFALHASAVEIDGVAYAFMGRSGAGKSTLVRPPIACGRRIADDILPWSVPTTGGMEVRPWFPQLKLGFGSQVAGHQAERLPFGGIFLIDGPVPRSCDVYGDKVSPVGATIALARHTVAARLFGPALLERQLEASTTLAERLPVVRLGYARRHDLVPAVHRFVAAHAARVRDQAR